MKNIYILILLTVSFAFNGLGQTTLILQPDSTTGKDAYISNWPTGDYENTNFGTDPSLAAVAWTEGAFYIGRSLLQFDFSSIPAGATILSATLTLYNDPTSAQTGGEHSHLSGSNAAWLQRVTSSWSQYAVTWNTQPSATTTHETALPEDTNPHENYTIDVASLVQDMIDSSSLSFGFMLSLQTEEEYRSLVFASSHNADSTLHPKLVITYITGCTNLVLQPDSATGNDAYISNWPTGDYENTNFGTDPSLAAVAWTEGASYIGRALLQFDLSSLPAGSIISSATLTLYNDPTSAQTGGEHSHLSGSNAGWLQRVTSSWNQYAVTWNTQPSATTLHETGLPEDTNPHENYVIDVASLVQDMIDSSSSSFGFMLSLQAEQYYRSLVFASSHNANGMLHPKLDICYTVSAPIGGFQSSERNLCEYNCVNFTDQSSNATSWQWLFPGATPSSDTVQNPQHICYFSAGSYSVEQIASNGSKSDTLIYNNYIIVESVPINPVITRSGDTLFCSTNNYYSSYQWYSDSAIISGATNSYYVVSHSGNYNVQVTNENGCSIAGGINVILGIQNYFINNIISLYPNPAINQLTIHPSSFINESVTVTVMDMLGEITQEEKVMWREDLNIDISSLSAGIYFVRIANENDNWVGKFVKQ